MWEHPEDLGDVAGEHPGSIWQRPFIRDLAVLTAAITFAIQQCHFGAETPKPTRFLATIKTDDNGCWFKWPSFSVDHKYLGPRPKECGHIHQKKLIGKTATGWATSPSAAYPPGLCEFLATLILSTLCLVGRGAASSVAWEGSGKSLPSDNGAVAIGDDLTLSNKVDKGSLFCGSANSFDNTLNKQPLGTVALGSTNSFDNTLSKQSLGDQVVGSPHSVEMEGETGFNMSACKKHGQPISVEWDAKSRFFIDGFGLCSPTRWQPWDCGVNRSSEAKALLASIYSMLLQEVVSAVGDPRRVCYELVLGRLKSSPFPTKAVGRFRSAICALLGVNDSAMEVPQGQPFHLHLVARVLKVVGDPDSAILVDCNDSFATGVPIGVEEPLPRTQMVFPPKERHRKLDDSDFNPIAENYASAQLSKEELETMFREEEALGRMFPSKLSVLQAEYGDRLRVASMAAITKPDGGISGLCMTAPIRSGSTMISPTGIAPNGLGLLKWRQWSVNVLSRGRLHFLVADIKSAHRLVKIRPQDWGCAAVQILILMLFGATK